MRILNLLNKNKSKSIKVKKTDKVFDYTKVRRGWGQDYAVTNIKEDGKFIHVMGWWPNYFGMSNQLGLPRKGDLIILPYAGSKSPYRVIEDYWISGVGDMFSVDCVFESGN